MPRFLKKILSPFLQLIARYYLSRTRWYSFGSIRLKVNPGVFHPGLFFSTRVLVDYLANVTLKGSRVLELGAGSGLLATYCFRQGAVVTASDISTVAIENLKENIIITGAAIRIVESDLFDHLSPDEFDWIVINPPYFPRTPENEVQKAWYCGVDFDYFQKLFSQLAEKRKSGNKIIMVLSEDCDFQAIQTVAARFGFSPASLHESKNLWEKSVVWGWNT